MRSDCQIFTYILIVWSLVFLIVVFKMVESFICVFACIITCNYTCNLWKNTTAFSFVIFAGPLHAYTQKTNIVYQFRSLLKRCFCMLWTDSTILCLVPVLLFFLLEGLRPETSLFFRKKAVLSHQSVSIYLNLIF